MIIENENDSETQSKKCGSEPRTSNDKIVHPNRNSIKYKYGTQDAVDIH